MNPIRLASRHHTGWTNPSNPTDQNHISEQKRFDFHVHDLPPQMGGCFEAISPAQQIAKKKVDNGPWNDLNDCLYDENELEDDPKQIALERMLLFKSNVIKANPMRNKFDLPLRQAMTYMMTGQKCEGTVHDMDNDKIAKDELEESELFKKYEEVLKKPDNRVR